MTVLLVGDDVALLEGLSQSLAALGHCPKVIPTLREARQLALAEAPLIVVAERRLASEASAEMLSIPLAPGGALVLFTSGARVAIALPQVMQRAVLADLQLPLERNRLVALVQHVKDRVQATGRGSHATPPEQRAV